MKFCQPHWDSLRAAIQSRGLGALIPDTGEEAMDALVSQARHGANVDNFDPLMGAHWLIVQNIAAIDPSVLIFSGCPICYANESHQSYCEDPTCDYGPKYFDSWIGHAADDMVDTWKAMGDK